MSTTEIRSSATDTYTILQSYDISDSITETAIAQSLVQSAYDYDTINTDSSGNYISPVNSSSWTVETLNTNYINTSAISNYPNGTVTEYSAISTKLVGQDVSTNSYTTNISSNACSNNTYTFQTLPTSASYYNSNYVVTQSLVSSCVDNQSGDYVNAVFDINASNAKIQYAMQSRWNTTKGPYSGLDTVGDDPTAMTNMQHKRHQLGLYL